MSSQSLKQSLEQRYTRDGFMKDDQGNVIPGNYSVFIERLFTLMDEAEQMFQQVIEQRGKRSATEQDKIDQLIKRLENITRIHAVTSDIQTITAIESKLQNLLTEMMLYQEQLPDDEVTTLNPRLQMEIHQATQRPPKPKLR